MRKTLLCLLVAGLAPAGWAVPLTLTFDATGITASGATAAGQVAWLGVARVPMQYFQKISQVSESATADAAGTATLSLGAPAPRRSLWVAVDVATGAFLTGTPEDYPIFAEPLSGDQLALDGENRVIGLLLAQQEAQVLLVRPGTGAWSLTVVDGSPADLDSAVNTEVAVNLTTLEPLGSAAAPSALQAGDVVVVIDPNRLSYAAVLVAANLLTPGGK